ncbi:hypothetical protein BS50DRAFT_570850 [Corynespora cassiicola Philippines]|uniref:1,3-beta-glucanosyltransferase n=1 Tax=Corynespora cassiicola Philippines TaxID=1448308 RepID=A0A2T2P1E6_CORCC|nr:hypothetical protein BS50DRAFT_570850 [Corynespora cassiicola Philippines]
MLRFLWRLFTALSVVTHSIALPTIEIKGSKFFTSDGDQFYIKGVAYSSDVTSVNNLVDGPQCEIDAKLMQKLGANVIRVYSVDPTLDHSRCMKAFEDAGIYVLIDAATPTININRAEPEWTIEKRNEFVKILDGFHGYDNFLGVFAGNEVINDASTSIAAPYVKAVIADLKAYRDAMQYRKIPIGYSAMDNLALQKISMDYFDCGTEETAADFYAFNKYSWCGDSSMNESGYDTLYEEADGFDIPIFLSETGCFDDPSARNPSRSFEDQVAMLGREMNDRYSGNIIYEWTMQVNGYGIVSYPGSKATGTPSLLGDYSRLSSQWATLSPAGVKMTSYDPTLTKRACPTSERSTWSVEKDAVVPTLGLSGFTTPTAPRASSTSSPTESVGESVAGEASGSARQDSAQSTGSGAAVAEESSSNISAGAIAGGVLGGLVGIALILGAILLCVRRKKKQKAAVDDGEHKESDKMVYDPEDPTQHTRNYGSGYPELHADGTVQELDPTRGKWLLTGPMRCPLGTQKANSLRIDLESQTIYLRSVRMLKRAQFTDILVRLDLSLLHMCKHSDDWRWTGSRAKKRDYAGEESSSLNRTEMRIEIP